MLNFTTYILLVIFSPFTINVVCSLICLYCKQYGPRSDCFLRSSQIRVHSVCFSVQKKSEVHLNLNYSADVKSRQHFHDKKDIGRIGIRYVNSCLLLTLAYYCRLLITFANSLDAWSGSKLFDTLMVILKEYFEKDDFENISSWQKLPSRQDCKLTQLASGVNLFTICFRYVATRSLPEMPWTVPC